MEPNNYVITFQAFMVGVLILGWFLIQRNFGKADKQAEEDKVAQKAVVADLQSQVKEANKKCDDHFNDLEKRIRDAELSLKEKISREELQTVVKELYDKMQKVQDDLNDFIRNQSPRKRK